MDHQKKWSTLTWAQKLMSFFLIAYVISLLLLYQAFLSNRGAIFTLVDRLHLESMKIIAMDFLSFMTSLFDYNITPRQLDTFSATLSLIITVTCIPYLLLFLINVYKLSSHIEIGPLRKHTPTENEKNSYLYYDNGFIPFVTAPGARTSIASRTNGNRNRDDNTGIFREPNEALLDYYNSAVKNLQKFPILIMLVVSVLFLSTLGMESHASPDGSAYWNFAIITFFVVVLFVSLNELLMYLCVFILKNRNVELQS